MELLQDELVPPSYVILESCTVLFLCHCFVYDIDGFFCHIINLTLYGPNSFFVVFRDIT